MRLFALLKGAQCKIQLSRLQEIQMLLCTELVFCSDFITRQCPQNTDGPDISVISLFSQWRLGAATPQAAEDKHGAGLYERAAQK